MKDGWVEGKIYHTWIFTINKSWILPQIIDLYHKSRMFAVIFPYFSHTPEDVLSVVHSDLHPLWPKDGMEATYKVPEAQRGLVGRRMVGWAARMCSDELPCIADSVFL